MLENSESQTDGGDLYLGTLLGRRQAFTTIAARCTAADAAALRDIRNRRAYRSLSATFEEFCSKHLGVSERHANRLIHYLNEFGPAYFELAQLTGISPAEYRAIAPAVKDEAVHCGDEVIALLPENAEKLAAAVAQLRASAPVPTRKPLSVERRLRRLERDACKLAGALSALIPAANSRTERVWLASILGAMHLSMERLERELGPVQ